MKTAKPIAMAILISAALTATPKVIARAVGAAAERARIKSKKIDRRLIVFFIAPLGKRKQTYRGMSMSGNYLA
jgi:hypothetical protein